MKFAELDAEAQERIRQAQTDCHGWWDTVYSDVIHCGMCLGITTSANGIAFSGFCSQGDGASYVGGYSYKDDALKTIKQHAPEEKTLHQLAERLTILQTKTRFLSGGKTLSAEISRDRATRYSHEHTMDIEVTILGEDDPNILIADEEELKCILRDFARWIYRQLEAEYEFLSSDEAQEGIDFDEDGSPII